MRITDGSFDFSGGVDSSSTPTARSQVVPYGLPRSRVAWLSNGTARRGGITQRYGWAKLCTVATNKQLYNGGILYDQLNGNPYLMLSIGGRIYQVRVDTNNSVKDITGGLTPNPSTTQAYFCQAEQFVVIQAGDWSVNNVGTLPMIWDGNTLRRSFGIISANNTPNGGVQPYNEIPAALAMTYFQGRLWYANGRQYCAGDIVGGPSGSAAYEFSDSVLKITENPLALGGDGFTVPTSAGNITALSYTAQLDATLGQGNLYIFTRRQINALIVPVSRAAWIAAGNGTGSTTNPTQLVALTRSGTPSERSVVRVNGDLFFVSPEPAIRSLTVATRYFEQWGNVPISRNVQRIMDFTNPVLLGLSPGIQFDNRLLMGVLPTQSPVGTVYQGLAALDFDLISTLDEKLPPAWEGMWEGLDILQLFEGDFGGQQRAFAVAHSRNDNSIQVWELTTGTKNDGNDSRVIWRFETPAYTWNKEFDLKKLVGGEIWIDRLSGTIDVTVEYRADSDVCWQQWMTTQFCAARTSCEDATNPICYPVQPYCEGNRFPLTLPEPQAFDGTNQNNRPSSTGYQFQVRLTIKGFMRVRGVLLHAVPVERRTFEGLESSSTAVQPLTNTKLYYNAPQSCTLECPDGSPFTFTTAAGLFSAPTQALADQQATQFACSQAQARMVCLSALSATTADLNVPFLGVITATGGELATGEQDNFWSLNAGSNLPPGLTFNGGVTSSNQATITGIPTTIGNYSFGVTVIDAQGNTMSKQYEITVTCLATVSLTQNNSDSGPAPFSLQVNNPNYQPGWTVALCLNVPGDLSTNTCTLVFSNPGSLNLTMLFAANVSNFADGAPDPTGSSVEVKVNGVVVHSFNFTPAAPFDNAAIPITVANCVPVTVQMKLVSTVPTNNSCQLAWQGLS